jgi:hypothetical protein
MSHLLNNLKLATAELTTARQKLADAQFQARHGMANNLDFASMVEGTAYHNWMRASAAFQASH